MGTRWIRLCVLLIGSLGAAHSLFGFPDPEKRPDRVALKKPNVIRGEGLVEKSALLRDESLGLVTHIVRNPTREATLGVAGVSGAVFLKPNGSASSRVKFADPKANGLFEFFFRPNRKPSHVQFVDLNGHGDWAFMNRGGEGWGDSSLIGGDGKTLWTCGGGIDDMASGDLDGDGIADFVVGFNGGDGVKWLDENGAVKWKQQDANVWHVEIVDTDGDGKSEVVHTNAGGVITIRDRDGNVLNSLEPGIYCSDFSLCRWPTAKDPHKLLVVNEGRFYLIDFNGKFIAQADVPKSAPAQKAYAATVRLKAGEPEFLAVAFDCGLFYPSVLCLFKPDMERVYEEKIGDRCTSLCAVPLETSEREALLIGGTNVVWKYQTAAPKPRVAKSK